MTNKRQKIQDHILKVYSTMEPGNYNHDRIKSMFDKMSDQEFDKWMNDLKEQKTKLTFFAPNMKIVLKTQDLLDAAKLTNSIIFDKLWMVDQVTGQEYLTNYEYIILRVPIRRTRQFLMHKLAVADSDKRIDNLTGQVVKPDKASSMSFVEAQLLYARGGLDDVLVEFMKVRGGDIHAYANFKQQLEENGSIYLESLDNNTVVRSTVVLSTILKCMLIDNNLV